MERIRGPGYRPLDVFLMAPARLRQPRPTLTVLACSFVDHVISSSLKD